MFNYVNGLLIWIDGLSYRNKWELKMDRITHTSKALCLFNVFRIDHTLQQELPLSKYDTRAHGERAYV